MTVKNRAFREMTAPALKRLEHRLPEEIAEKTGIVFIPSEHLFKVHTMHQIIELDYPSYAAKQQIGQWHYLLILHYMDLADGTPYDERLITFSGLKDGLIRGTRFDQYADMQLAAFLKHKSSDDILMICERLGGSVIPSKADLCVRFSFLPLYPVILKFWFEDEEFPASGKMFLSKNADHFLTVEDAVTVGEVILQKLNESNSKGMV